MGSSCAKKRERKSAENEGNRRRRRMEGQRMQGLQREIFFILGLSVSNPKHHCLNIHLQVRTASFHQRRFAFEKHLECSCPLWIRRAVGCPPVCRQEAASRKSQAGRVRPRDLLLILEGRQAGVGVRMCGCECVYRYIYGYWCVYVKVKGSLD